MFSNRKKIKLYDIVDNLIKNQDYIYFYRYWDDKI
jgi:hypothetical protein